MPKFIKPVVISLTIVFLSLTFNSKAQADKTQITPLTQNASVSLEYSLTIDGNYAAYARVNAGSSIRDLVIQYTHTREVKVVDSFEFTTDLHTSLDQNNLVWSTEDGHIMLYDINKSEKKQISDPFIFAAYPYIRGNMVVWQTIGYGGQGDLFLYDLKTGITRQITNDNEPKQSPSFYQNKVAYRQSGNIKVLDLSTGTSTWISHETVEPADEPYIYKNFLIYHTYSSVYLYNFLTQQVVGVGSTSSFPILNSRIESARMYNDKVVYTITGISTTSSYIGQVYFYDIKTGVSTRVTNGGDLEREGAITNQYIIFTSSDSGDDTRDIYLYRY